MILLRKIVNFREIVKIGFLPKYQFFEVFLRFFIKLKKMEFKGIF